VSAATERAGYLSGHIGADAKLPTKDGPHGDTMNRERALKVVLVSVGLLFLALIYPLTMFFSSEAALAMMLSLYVTLGIFLLIAARNPSANRSLIAFTAWSSFAHAAVNGESVHPLR
jgi:hypothetical protein